MAFFDVIRGKLAEATKAVNSLRLSKILTGQKVYIATHRGPKLALAEEMLLKHLSAVFAPASFCLLAGLPSGTAMAAFLENIPAVMAPHQVAVKHYLPDALRVEVTPRGQTYFQNQFDNVLSNLGVTLNEAYFSDIQWQSTTSYSVDKFNLDPDTQKLVSTVRDALNSWFTGFSLSSVKPAIEIGNSGYQAVFNRFAITADENLLKQLNKNVGAVLVVEVDVKEINATATSIRAWDQNNADLGKVGFDKVNIKVAGGKTPLQLRMPFYVTINDQGIPQFQAVGITDNIDKIDLEFTYGKVVIPQVQLVVNGKVMPFNEATLDSQFSKGLPNILSQIRTFLHKFVSEQVPTLLNNKAKSYLVQSLEEVKDLDAPGAPDGSNDQFQWGLQLKGISENNSFSIDLNSFVEDANNSFSLPLKNASARNSPQMAALPKTAYDIGVSIDEGMINRILQLSFEKKLFDKIALDGNTAAKPQCQSLTSGVPNTSGKFLRLTKVPLLQPLSTNHFTAGTAPAVLGETFAQLNLQVQVPPGTVTGIDKMAIKDSFLMSFKLVVKLVKNVDSKSIGIQLWDVIPGSVQIDPNDLTPLGKMLKGTVTGKVQNEFMNMAKDWRCEGSTIPGTVPVPSVLGLNLDITHLSMEQNGHIVLYLSYAHAVTQSLAINPQNFPVINVNNLSRYQGKYLSAFYASGRPSGVGLSADHLSLEKVYKKLADMMITGDQIQLPAQNIQWQGFDKPNVVMLVVHDKPGFTWLNQDPEGRQPVYAPGISLSNNTRYDAVSTLWSHNFASGNQVFNFSFNNQ